MFQPRLLDAAAKDLANLDKPVAKRIVKRLHWLAENLEKIKPEPLSSDLASLFKFRVGDYRILYQIFPKEEVILVHCIGHRREIYRKK